MVPNRVKRHKYKITVFYFFDCLHLSMTLTRMIMLIYFCWEMVAVLL